MIVEEKTFDAKIEQVQLELLMYDEFYRLIWEAKSIGYRKAMRWRDLREEKPQFIKGKDLTLLIKDDNCIWLGDFMDEAHFNFNTKDRGIIFWRPIE